MRLRHVLLVLIAERPHTGYDVTQRMQKTMSMIWSAHHSQIYPELAAMEADGLLTCEAGAGPGPREKKTYTVTEAGRHELRIWLGSPYQPRAPKDELVLRAFAAASADPAELAAVYEEETRQIEGRLARYATIRAEVEESGHTDDPTRPEFGHLLSLLHGIAVAEARLVWCRDTVRRLRAADLVR
ncbi:PadR family transcriptional regulator [Nocardioides speluncae]|uniref:PadR family transcriptional regulator n=1 Tax=Nocardioides speluncae TaxID=2670337 RepID=UPI0012B17304|nr:PadR family transcriptional regulator [Nocardioides speluncae]